MHDDWSTVETNTHQDHVIAHVVGATVLGYFTANEAAHFLLDIGFIWIVFLDGEMGLVPQSMAIAELEVDETTKAQLRGDVQQLDGDVGAAEGLSRITHAPTSCLITEVSFYALGDERRLVIEGEGTSLALETSLMNREIRIEPI